MTIEKEEYMKELVDEMNSTGMPVATVWEYVNAMNKKKMFAVFAATQSCDIFQSPVVLEPKLIYEQGKFINGYEHLN